MDMRELQSKGSPLRSLKAEDLVRQVVRIGKGIYEVPSQTGNGRYLVRTGKLQWTCTCPDHMFRGSVCKHMLATSELTNRPVPQQSVSEEDSRPTDRDYVILI